MQPNVLPFVQPSRIFLPETTSSRLPGLFWRGRTDKLSVRYRSMDRGATFQRVVPVNESRGRQSLVVWLGYDESMSCCRYRGLQL